MEKHLQNPSFIESKEVNTWLAQAFGFVIVILLGLVVYLAKDALTDFKKDREKRSAEKLENALIYQQTQHKISDLTSALTRLTNQLEKDKNTFATKAEVDVLKKDIDSNTEILKTLERPAWVQLPFTD